jgi:hypothetical protein
MGFLGLGGVIIAIAIAKETGVIGHDFAKRGVGIILGLMLIGVGNLLPKFHLFDSSRRDPAQTLALERFAGWVFVIAGAAYAIIWAFVPMPSVIVISSIVGLSSFVLVALDWIRRAVTTKPSATTRPATGAAFDKRLLLGTMLLTLGYGIAMFLVDNIWGDAVSDWVAIAFASLLALGSVPLLAARSRVDN